LNVGGLLLSASDTPLAHCGQHKSCLFSLQANVGLLLTLYRVHSVT